jgi:putative ABC transport system ATP-binding protein
VGRPVDFERPMSDAAMVIRTRGLTKTYVTGATEVRALRDVDFDVRQGEMVSIMGASGSGKSTLMNILGCLDRPTSGTYELDGIRVDGMDRNARADIRNQRIGFVFQGFNLLPRTSALEQVELPLLYDRTGRKENSRVMASRALQRVGLGDRMDHEPSELSGGQQQRVALARALVTEPAIVLADEPTGNLDTRTSIEMLAVFQELNAQGITILVITHEHEIARYAKRIVRFRDGRLMQDEPVLDRRDALHDLAEWHDPDEDDAASAFAPIPASEGGAA